MRLRPMGDRLIIKIDEVKEINKSGIIIPVSGKDRPQEGTVLAIGPGLKKEDGTFIPMNIAVGNKILYGKFAGLETKIDEETLLILREEDVLGILE